MALSAETKRKIGEANRIRQAEKRELFPVKFWGMVNKTDGCWLLAVDWKVDV